MLKEAQRRVFSTFVHRKMNGYFRNRGSFYVLNQKSSDKIKSKNQAEK